MSHLEERMEADLNHIREWLWKIGDDVEDALRKAKKTLMLRDEKLAYETVLGDYPINRESRECDRLCHMFIARFLPGAGHLREMASTIRVNVALERIGDYAVTMCREALQLDGPLPEKFSLRLDELADEAIMILSESRRAFRDGNPDRAIVLMKMAKGIEAKMDPIYEELFAEDDRIDGRTMMVIFVMFTMLKRVADQAKNICDQTVYFVRGVAKIPKVFRILFLDQPGSGAGQLAVAIGRKNHAGTAEFAVAAPGHGQAPAAELQEFLAETGLPQEDLETEPLKALEHDFADYTLLISLAGEVSDYVQKVPFHSSALNWSLPDGQNRADQYRYLRDRISDLLNLLAGDEAARD